MGLFRAIETVLTLAFVFPAVLLGVESLLAGDPLGWVFLALAAVAFGVSVFVDTPADWAESAAGRVVGTVAKPPDDEE